MCKRVRRTFEISESGMRHYRRGVSVSGTNDAGDLMPAYHQLSPKFTAGFCQLFIVCGRPRRGAAWNIVNGSKEDQGARPAASRHRMWVGDTAISMVPLSSGSL